MDDLVDRKLLAEMRGWVPLSLWSDGIGCPRSTVCRNAPIPAAHLARPLPTPPIAQARTPRGASRRREHERKRREGARRRRRRPLLDGAQAGASVLPPRDRRPPRVSARATSQPRSPLPRRFINLLAVPRSPTSPQGAVERELVGVKSASARKDLELAAEKKLTRDLRARLDATLDKLDDALALPAGSSVSSDLALAAAEDETRDLRARLAAALSENASLKRFLKDYGMTWVGDDDEARAPPPRVRCARTGSRRAPRRRGARRSPPAGGPQTRPRPRPRTRPHPPRPRPPRPHPRPHPPRPPPPLLRANRFPSTFRSSSVRSSSSTRWPARGKAPS